MKCAKYRHETEVIEDTQRMKGVRIDTSTKKPEGHEKVEKGKRERPPEWRMMH
jgi:hypothetical protein